MDSARLTITDLIMVLVAVAAIAGLQPVYSSLTQNLSGVDPMTRAIAQVFLPAVALLLIAIVAGRATGGLR